MNRLSVRWWPKTGNLENLSPLVLLSDSFQHSGEVIDFRLNLDKSPISHQSGTSQNGSNPSASEVAVAHLSQRCGNAGNGVTPSGELDDIEKMMSVHRWHHRGVTKSQKKMDSSGSEELGNHGLD